MTIQGIILGIVVSSLLGLGFHLWRGGSLPRLVLYLFLGWLGFWVGHWIGALLNFALIKVGGLNLGVAMLGSILFLLGGQVLFVAEFDENAIGSKNR